MLASSTKYWRVVKNLLLALKGAIENPYKNPSKGKKTEFCKKIKI